MTQQSIQQAQADARRKFDELRKSIDRFQLARTTTDNAALGVVPNRRKLQPAMVAQRVRELRDIPAMERAVSELYDLLTVLYDREPTEDELKAGPPSGAALGNFAIPSVPPSVSAVAGLAFGAWTLTSLFDYLRTREERIQLEMGIQSPTNGSSGLVGALGILGLVGAVGVGGYLLYKHRYGEGSDEEGGDEDEETPAEEGTSYHIHRIEPGKISALSRDESEEEPS